MANRTEENDRLNVDTRLSVCLACGVKMESALSRLGSLRCHDCRDTSAPLDPRRVDQWRQDGAHI